MSAQLEDAGQTPSSSSPLKLTDVLKRKRGAKRGAVGSRKSRTGCAVGALLIPKRHAQPVLSSLPPRWKKRGVPVVPVGDGMLAVALSPEGARAMDAGEYPNDALAQLLATRTQGDSGYVE